MSDASTSNMKKYMVRDKASVPRRVYLRDPATGKETKDYLEIRSSLSDEFIEARDAAMQRASEFIPNPEERKASIRENQLRLRASLVAGWSFPEPATEKNVMEFLREAPQIGQMVLVEADDNASFFGEPSGNSSTGPKKK